MRSTSEVMLYNFEMSGVPRVTSRINLASYLLGTEPKKQGNSKPRHRFPVGNQFGNKFQAKNVSERQKLEPDSKVAAHELE